jgi:MinD-like ATPase involved in chromosome partitioning or flagellar assembly
MTTGQPVIERNGSALARSRVAPLLAVCGVCGGAGASTVSYLIARAAASTGKAHVLVCDTGGPTGGLALRAGVESVRSLAEASEHVARELPLAGGLYSVVPQLRGDCELRVIATGPRLGSPGNPKGLRALLAMARSDGAHALTVVDCGTLQRAAERFVLRRASHVAWVLPATDDGIRHAERLLACVRPAGQRAELVVARRVARVPRGSLRRLRVLAETRDAPLVLMPDADEIGRAQVGLQAILGVLER